MTKEELKNIKYDDLYNQVDNWYKMRDSYLKALDRIEMLEKPLEEAYERFKHWGGIVEDFAKIHQKDGRPASENLSDIQGHFLVELWKAIKQALGIKEEK